MSFQITSILTTHKSASHPDYQDSATTAPAIHSLYEYQATGNYTYCQSMQLEPPSSLHSVKSERNIIEHNLKSIPVTDSILHLLYLPC